MTSKVNKILSKEHENIIKLIHGLENECDSIEEGKKIDKEFLIKAIDFIRNYADKFHHAKEEDLLFKEFCKNEGKLHCNPVDQMLHEHDLGRNFVKNLEQGVKNMDKDKIIENARGYCNLLKDHIFKEDNILYPMADEVISDKVQKDLLKKFEKVENKVSKEKINKYIKFAEGAEKR